MKDAHNTATSSISPGIDPQTDMMGAQPILVDGVPSSGVATQSRRRAPDTEPEQGLVPGEVERPDGSDENAALAHPEANAAAPAMSGGAIDPTPPPNDDATAADATTTTEPDPAIGGADGKEPRRRRRTRAVEENGEDGDAGGALGPMVRHLSTLTKELSEAQRTVGRLSAERDVLRRQLSEAQAKSVLLVDGQNEGLRPNKEARLEARAAKHAERETSTEPVPTPEELQSRAQDIGHRRRIIALGVLALIGATMGIWRLMGWPSPIENVTKQGLTGIAYIGPFMNVLIGGFLIYRIVRVGGKAGNWLFPSPEGPKKRRR